jgi:hypothetical protein
MLSKQRIGRIEWELSGQEFEAGIESLILLFAEIFLESVLTNGSESQLMQLVMHERQEPHLPQGMFLSEVIQPLRNAMRQALLKICPELNHTDADFCLQSIIVQLLNVLQIQNLFKGIDENEMPFLNKEKSIEHIVRFSTGGIRQYRRIETISEEG